MSTPSVALSRDFLDAQARLPQRVQKKVNEFLDKFRSDPTQPGLNFERLDMARDPKVRSVRVDQAHRAIVIHPPKGDVFLCVWVARHDDAYAWVKDRQFEVNASTGSLQVYSVDEALRAAAPAVAVAPERERQHGGLFAEHDDDWLLLAGVPPVLLPAVRALCTDADLDRIAPHLPDDASQALYAIAAGLSPEEAIEEQERVLAAAIDTEDFSAALARPATQSRFHVVENEVELAAILSAPLEQWRVFLHPSQRRLVKMKANGPVRVLGGAGTGKTVVLVHRARELAERVFDQPSDRLLVTCYNRTLAADLRRSLASLCTPEALARIEVTNLHQWATAFLRRNGVSLTCATNTQRERWMQAAMDAGYAPDLPLGFFLDEWDQVVQPLEDPAQDHYLRARRVGRGRRVSRAMRDDIWTVLERYRTLLNKANLVEWPDLVRTARALAAALDDGVGYRAVLADEAQDFGANDFRLLRTLAPEGPNTLMLVGVGHQRLYGKPVPLSVAGIDIRGRSRRLRVNYRTTEQIRLAAVAVIEGVSVDDLDGEQDSLKGYRSLRGGPAPEIAHFTTQAQELAFVTTRLREWLEAGVKPHAICVAARTRAPLQDRFGPAIVAAGIKVLALDDTWDDGGGAVRLSTMHRLKGLEFSRVLLAGVQSGTMPLRLHSRLDDAELAAHDYRERCLFYVAATRARDELAICGCGGASPFLTVLE